MLCLTDQFFYIASPAVGIGSRGDPAIFRALKIQRTSSRMLNQGITHSMRCLSGTCRGHIIYIVESTNLDLVLVGRIHLVN